MRYEEGFHEEEKHNEEKGEHDYCLGFIFDNQKVNDQKHPHHNKNALKNILFSPHKTRLNRLAPKGKGKWEGEMLFFP